MYNRWLKANSRAPTINLFFYPQNNTTNRAEGVWIYDRLKCCSEEKTYQSVPEGKRNSVVLTSAQWVLFSRYCSEWLHCYKKLKEVCGNLFVIILTSFVFVMLTCRFFLFLPFALCKPWESEQKRLIIVSNAEASTQHEYLLSCRTISDTS